MTKLIMGATARDIAQALIANFQANAPFHVLVGNREDLAVTDMEIMRDDEGRCILSVRVEDIKRLSGD